ncbi:MAG: glycosyltransferase [Bacilli bacterium]|nr:glycosyltransferase [Bacilli bacterium]
MKVSVIVPVYNVEKYIDKCLDSLVKQTLKDLEIIVVNDGSPDNSEKIIQKYAKKYKNIKYLVKENGGLSDARNYGLKYAKGEYIAFLDSDDYVSADMYEKMYEKAISEDFDMVVCDINYLYPDNTLRVDGGIKEDTKDIKKTFLTIHPAAWNKIFKKELFTNKVFFKKGVWFEDVEFIYRLLPYVKSIGVIHEAYNQYVQREGSITNTINPKIYDYISNMNGVVEYFKKNKLYDNYQKELEYAYVRYIYATFIRSIAKYDYEEYEKGVQKALQSVKAYFPKYRHNKYFYQSKKGIYLVLFSKPLAKLLYKVFHK